MEVEISPDLSEKAQLDYRLVKAAIDGDQKAYAQLMDRYRDSIYFMLLKMVNNRDDADDLTIEAFGNSVAGVGRGATRLETEYSLLRQISGVLVGVGIGAAAGRLARRAAGGGATTTGQSRRLRGPWGWWLGRADHQRAEPSGLLRLQRVTSGRDR